MRRPGVTQRNWITMARLQLGVTQRGAEHREDGETDKGTKGTYEEGDTDRGKTYR